MDLKTFDFPELTGIDMQFSTLKTDATLLEEAKKRGFYNRTNNEYVSLFSKVFFEGGTVKFKDDVDEDFKSLAWPYCRALMMSFEPQHEEKEAICAMLMSELLEPKLK